MKWNWSKLIDRLMNVALSACALIVLWILAQVFCFTGFKIPTDSMSPVLQPGDRIIVNKFVQGARLFDVFDALEGKDVAIRRLPGIGGLRRNDIVVFNFPYVPNRWDSIRFDVMLYYVKRCIGLPGDTLEIRDGYYRVRGCRESLGNVGEQRILSSYSLEELKRQRVVTRTFPYKKEIGWNIREFGPLPVPRKGQEVEMGKRTAALYKPLIEWEQKCKLRRHGDTFSLGDSVIHAYRFLKNYYFVAGDKATNSQDSRYWGLLPEEYIVGKVTRIWSSRDKDTGKVRWNRVLKKVE